MYLVGIASWSVILIVTTCYVGQAFYHNLIKDNPVEILGRNTGEEFNGKGLHRAQCGPIYLGRVYKNRFGYLNSHRSAVLSSPTVYVHFARE